MYSRWLLSLSFGLLCAGLGSAQPAQKPPISSTGDRRATVPAGLPAPKNKLNERATVRGFADSGDARTTLAGQAARTLTQSGRSPRDYVPADQTDLKRAALEPTTPRDRSLFRVSPTDKVNRIPDATGAGRNFAEPGSVRSALPMTPVPSDRHGIDQR